MPRHRPESRVRRIDRHALRNALLCCALAAPLSAQFPAPVRWVYSDLFGPTAFEHFGETILGVGDWNGDARADLLVGAPGRGIGGGIALVSGATGREIWSYAGTAAGGQLGWSMDFASDLTSDGVREWLVGAPSAGTGGEVLVFNGATGALLQTLATTLQGVGFGSAVAGIGDADNDNLGDFAVGSPQARLGANGNVGMVEVFSSRTFVPIPGRTYYGVNANETFGFALSGGSDVDGDGNRDLVVGAPGDALPRTVPGFVHVYANANGSLLRSASGSARGELYGCAVAGIGDVNGDGYGDVLVGARAFSPVPGQDLGKAVVLSGYELSDPQLQIITLHSSTGATWQRYGTRTAAIGDVDGDGIPDFAVGANTIGSWALSLVRIYSGAGTGTLLAVFGGWQDAFGTSVAPVGDVDGDGFDDIAVGGPTADRYTAPQLLEAGRVAVFSLRGETRIWPQGRTCGSAQAPALFATGGPPSATLGTPGFAIELRYAAPLLPCVLWIGVPAAQWNGINLPFDLAPLGFSGCSIYMPIQVQLPISIGSQGTARVPFPIPRWAFLRYTSVSFQAVALNPASQFGVDFTRAQTIYIE